MRLDVDLDSCAANGEYAYAAPEVFRLDGETLHFDPTPDDALRADVELAVAACPTQAISFLDG